MKNLMSSTDFGKYIEKIVLRKEKPFEWYFNTRRAFDNFLSQKLEIWQFVPCKLVDGVWVVLEEPQIFKDLRMPEYQQAKEKCLFDGFRTDIKNKTIEDLVKYNLELTATAQKQIGFE